MDMTLHINKNVTAFVGPSEYVEMLHDIPAMQKCLLTTEKNIGPKYKAYVCRYSQDALPLDQSCVNLCVLAHQHEISEHLELLVHEISDAVVGEGHVAIVGFNPSSLFGIKKTFSSQSKNVTFHYATRMQSLFEKNGFEFVALKRTLFQFPTAKGLKRKAGALSVVLRMIFPWLSGGYILLMRKKTLSPTMVGLRWQARKKMMGVVKGVVPSSMQNTKE